MPFDGPLLRAEWMGHYYDNHGPRREHAEKPDAESPLDRGELDGVR